MNNSKTEIMDFRIIYLRFDNISTTASFTLLIFNIIFLVKFATSHNMTGFNLIIDYYQSSMKILRKFSFSLKLAFFVVSAGTNF